MARMPLYFKKVNAFFLIIFLSSISNENAFSAVFLKDLPHDAPKKVLVDAKDRFYLDYGRNVIAISNKKDYTVFINDPVKNYGSDSFDNEVSPSGYIYSITRSSYKPPKSKITYYRLNFVECIREQCTYQKLAQWSSGKSANYYTAGKLNISKNGNIHFLIIRHYLSGKEWKTSTSYYLNKKKTIFGKYQQQYNKDYSTKNRPIFIKSSSRSLLDKIYQEVTFIVNGVEQSHPSKRNSRYKRTTLFDNNGMPHIFFHDPENKGFYHQFYSPSLNEIIEVEVDRVESGGVNVAFLHDDEIWSIHYFYRDSFNKGLVAIQHDVTTGKIKERFIIDASEDRNTGWDLMGVMSSKHRFFLTFSSNINSHNHEYIILDEIEDIKNILASNFSNFGSPKGDGYLTHIPIKKRRGHINSLLQSHLKRYRIGYLNIGMGLQSVFWSVKSGSPEDESNVTTAYEANYKFSKSILSLLSMEGKIGKINFGAEYSGNLINTEVEKNGANSSKKLNKIAGKIGWDRLFMNYDFMFQYEKTSTDVLFEDNSKQVPDKLFTMDFSEMKFSLLTLKRYHFGYIYQKYNFYQPIYIYQILENSKAYSYVGQAIGDVNVNNHLVHFGHSTLNYITKYETNISQWFLDGEIRGGLSFSGFEDNVVVIGNKKPENESTITIGTQLEFGYIWYKRWKNLYQFGGVIKLSYRVDYSMIGDADKPDDREEAATKNETTFKFERQEIRHGPLIFVSLNF